MLKAKSNEHFQSPTFSNSRGPGDQGEWKVAIFTESLRNPRRSSLFAWRMKIGLGLPSRAEAESEKVTRGSNMNDMSLLTRGLYYR